MHADSAASTFVQLARTFDPAAGEAALDAAVADLTPVPFEAEAMRAAAQLVANEVARAETTIEAALGRAPGVTAVRFTAAVVFHACVAGSAAGSESRLRYVARRDVQVGWLLEQGNLDEARRTQVAGMRDVR